MNVRTNPCTIVLIASILFGGLLAISIYYNHYWLAAYNFCIYLGVLTTALIATR